MAARRGAPKRSEDRSLSRETILAEALALVDEVGLDKFSIRTLSQRLNVFPAAIYWWIPTRNAIFAELVNYVVRDVVPDEATSDWKEWLAELFRGHRAIIFQHPNIAPLLISQLLSNAGANFALVDRILGVLSTAGFSGEKLYQAYDIVITAKVGFVSMELAAVPEADSYDFQRVMEETIDGFSPDIYPHLCEHRDELRNRHFITRWENGVTVPLDASFEAFVYAIIEGLRQLLTR